MSNLARRRLIRQPWERWECRVIHRDGGPAPGERWSHENFLNNRYSVQISIIKNPDERAGDMLHLWVRRHDGGMPNSWADLQRIKDELTGPDRLAIQIFPPRDELVDQADLAHLWVYPPGYRLPFGLRP